MKRTVYIRISNKTKKMDISVNPNNRALDLGYRYSNKYFPTLKLKLNLEIPDELFDTALKELDLKIENAEICSDVRIEEEKHEN